MLNEPGGNIGGPLYIPHVYNENKTRTFFFCNEEWRRLIQGAAPSTASTIMASDFPDGGPGPQLYTVRWRRYHSGGAEPAQQSSLQLALETARGLTRAKPFPLNANGTYRIPAKLMSTPTRWRKRTRACSPSRTWRTATSTLLRPQPELRPRRHGAHRPRHQQQDAVDGPLRARRGAIRRFSAVVGRWLSDGRHDDAATRRIRRRSS